MAVRIKKYANRKLHAEGDVKYLSMLEVGERAAKDSDIQVVCDRTGRDLTLPVLARALYERVMDYYDEPSYLKTGRNKPAPFPVSEVTRLIALVPSRKKV